MTVVVSWRQHLHEWEYPEKEKRKIEPGPPTRVVKQELYSLRPRCSVERKIIPRVKIVLTQTVH